MLESRDVTQRLRLLLQQLKARFGWSELMPDDADRSRCRITRTRARSYVHAPSSSSPLNPKARQPHVRSPIPIPGNLLPNVSHSYYCTTELEIRVRVRQDYQRNAYVCSPFLCCNISCFFLVLQHFSAFLYMKKM